MFAIPARVLATECKAARVVQRAWRRSRAYGRQFKPLQDILEPIQQNTGMEEVCKNVGADVKDEPEAFLEWSPWAFLDRLELQAVCQTCTSLFDAVSIHTPFVEYGSLLPGVGPREEEVVM